MKTSEHRKSGEILVVCGYQNINAMCLMTAGEVKDRHIVILDDLVQTGGTLIDCAKVSL